MSVIVCIITLVIGFDFMRPVAESQVDAGSTIAVRFQFIRIVSKLDDDELVLKRIVACILKRNPILI